ncbi:MAG: alpha/beta hydrolase [Rhodospirillales bacterium]|nr:alpha/beta hydrolase [Rhodospirillales bacterium]
MKPVSKISKIEQLSVHYLEAGEGETIVFLHGAGGAPPESASFVSMLAAKHRVLLPSRPGFDETPLGDCATLTDIADIMAGFIRNKSDGPVHLVAQSAGGAVGCWLAVLYPELVSSLVLSAPSTFAVRHANAGGPPSPQEMDALLYGETPSWSGPPTEDERDRIAGNARANMARSQSADGNQDLLARLPEINALTLLLVGTGDRMIPPEAMAPIQKHIPNCQRVYIYGAAHELPISAGPQWVTLVSDFITRGEAFVVNVGSRDAL